MTSDSEILVVGATGLLGMEIVRLLRSERRPVRALLRSSCAESKRRILEDCGARLAFGDLRNRASLVEACRGVRTIVSTASATLSRQSGDSIHTVDHHGQLQLLEVAKQSSVEHFIFISFPSSCVDYALQRAKRAVETALLQSSMCYTIFQPAKFMEIWLSSKLGFEPRAGRVRVFGDGMRPSSWISVHDVARFGAAACDRRSDFGGRVLPLGGPESASQIGALKIFQEFGAPESVVEYVSESDLERRLLNSRDPIDEAYAASMLNVARGHVVDFTVARQMLPGKSMDLREYARTGYLTHPSTRETS